MLKNKSLIAGLIALILASSCCWLPALLLSMGAGALLMSLAEGIENLSLILLLLSVGFIVYGYFQLKEKSTKKNDVILESKLTCPECNAEHLENMLTDSCQYFYECASCKSILKPLDGDCCVYCSFGSVPCPPIQSGDNCC